MKIRADDNANLISPPTVQQPRATTATAAATVNGFINEIDTVHLLLLLLPVKTNPRKRMGQWNIDRRPPYSLLAHARESMMQLQLVAFSSVTCWMMMVTFSPPIRIVLFH